MKIIPSSATVTVSEFADLILMESTAAPHSAFIPVFLISPLRRQESADRRKGAETVEGVSAPIGPCRSPHRKRWSVLRASVRGT